MTFTKMSPIEILYSFELANTDRFLRKWNEAMDALYDTLFVWLTLLLCSHLLLLYQLGPGSKAKFQHGRTHRHAVSRPDNIGHRKCRLGFRGGVSGAVRRDSQVGFTGLSMPSLFPNWNQWSEVDSLSSSNHIWRVQLKRNLSAIVFLMALLGCPVQILAVLIIIILLFISRVIDGTDQQYNALGESSDFSETPCFAWDSIASMFPRVPR